MLISGLIHYEGHFEYTNQNDLRSGFLLSNGYIKEMGSNSALDSFLSFFIAVSDCSGNVKYASNLRNIDSAPSLDYFKNSILNSFKETPLIAVWFDEKDKRFYISRDAFGRIPIFYIHIPGKFFAFSTSILDLLDKKIVKYHVDISLNKIIAYTSRQHPALISDVSSTFFTQIKSALPGHLLTVDQHQVKLESHSFFNPGKWGNLKTLGEAGSLVREALTNSVSNSTSGSYLVGTHLSGGLDSSSVSSVFRHLYPDRPLHTFHIAANNYQSDESLYSSLVANDIGATYHQVTQSPNDFSSLELSTKLYGQPESSYLSPASNLEIISRAHASQCKVLLNGHGGDSIIGNGMELIGQSFVQRDWELFEDLLRKRVSYSTIFTRYPDWNTFSFQKQYHLILQNFLYKRLPATRALPIGELFKLYREVSNKLGISYYYFFKRASYNFLMRTLNRAVRSEPTILKDDLLELGERYSHEPNFPVSMRGSLSSEYQEVFDDVFNPHTIRSHEELFALSNHFGVSNRSPFMNFELFEICLAVPNIIKYGDGIGRAHLRDAMKNILVEEVRTRGNKSSLSSPDGAQMTLRLLEQGQHILYDVSEIWEYVDKTKFDVQVKILKNTKIPHIQKSASLLHITRTISLSLWLEWWRKNR